MRAVLLALLALPTLALAAPAGATGHCPGLLVADDGTHSVSQTGTAVTVNGAGVVASCFGFEAGVYETYVIDTQMTCRAARFTDDGVHSVTESGGTVHVNGAGLDNSCLVIVVVPESFFLP